MNKLRKIAASIGITFVVFSQLLFASSSSAEPVSGLNVDVYTYDSSSTPDRVPYTPCAGAWTHVDNIDFDFDAQFNGVVAGCQQEFTLVHFTGSVTFPDSGDYSFLALADDGFWMSLDNVPVITEDWVLKGRSGNTYPGIQIIGGHTYAFDAWFYEYGGGANATLYYSTTSQAFDVVPSSFFTTDGSAPVVVPPVVTPVDPNPPVVVPPVVPPVDPQPPVVVPPVTPVDPPVVPVTPVDPKPTDPGQGPVVVPTPPVETPTSVPTVEVPTSKPTTQETVTPEPPVTQVDPATIDPTTLSASEVVALQTVAKETLATEPEGSPAYDQALQQLYVAAQADDIVVDPQLASVPVLGAAVVGITNAVNALGNLGSDMSPAHRAKAKKEIVAAVVATGAAVNAVASAAGAASVSSGSSTSSRRKD